MAKMPPSAASQLTSTQYRSRLTKGCRKMLRFGGLPPPNHQRFAGKTMQQNQTTRGWIEQKYHVSQRAEIWTLSASAQLPSRSNRRNRDRPSPTNESRQPRDAGEANSGFLPFALFLARPSS